MDLVRSLILMILRGIRCDSCFPGLKVTSQVASHLVNLERSVFEQIAAARGLSTTTKRLVSSAKRRIFELNALTISLMLKKEKSLGPKIDPWGTQVSILTQSDVVHSSTTL